MTDHIHTGHGPDQTLDCPGCETAYWEKQKAAATAMNPPVEGSGGNDIVEAQAELNEANAACWMTQDELNDAFAAQLSAQDRIIRVVSIAVLIQAVTLVVLALVVLL